MAKKPVWIKVIIQIAVSFFTNSNSEGVKKIKPIALGILAVLCIALLAVFDPSAIESVLKFIINLL